MINVLLIINTLCAGKVPIVKLINILPIFRNCIISFQGTVCKRQLLN